MFGEESERQDALLVLVLIAGLGLMLDCFRLLNWYLTEVYEKELAMSDLWSCTEVDTGELCGIDALQIHRIAS